MRKVLLVVLAGAAGLLAGCNDCSFWARCSGNVREQCGGGVDQQVGRKVQSTPCAAPNPVCVEEDGGAHSFGDAVCAASREPCTPPDGGGATCGPAGLERCDPGLRVVVVQQACDAGCLEGDGGPRCAP